MVMNLTTSFANTEMAAERNARPLNIVHVLAPADVGGLERVVQMLSIGQQRRGHAVRVVASVTPGTDCTRFRQPLEAAGLRVELLTLGARNYFGERARVAELLRRERADVVHTHGFRPDVLHLGVARAAGAGVVTTLHGSERSSGRTRAYEWLQERAARRFDAVIAVSEPIGERLSRAGVPNDRLHVVPNAWSMVCEPLDRESARRALGLEHEERIIGWVGRLVSAKGCDVLLDALALMDGNYRCVIIGDGPLRGELEQQAALLGLAGRVLFLGSRHDAARYFRAFDLFVLSSRTEGTPIVLFEAMSAEVPIVATRVGGVPHVLTEAGAMLVPALSPAALSDAMRALLADAVQGQRCVAVARSQLLREHGERTWQERHEEIYRAVARASC